MEDITERQESKERQEVNKRQDIHVVKLLSIDVGIKNLSYCLLEVDSLHHSYRILQWEIVNLTETIDHVVSMCVHDGCGKPAKWTTRPQLKPKPKTTTNKRKRNEKEEQVQEQHDYRCFCARHAKLQASSNWMIPNKEAKSTATRKSLLSLSLDELQSIYGRYCPLIKDSGNANADAKQKKPYWVTKVKQEIDSHWFQEIKGENAVKIELDKVARNIMTKLGALLQDHLSTIDYLIVENQIGPLANRMKTVQGMLSQYFVMGNPSIIIEEISSSNKLKDFGPTIGGPKKKEEDKTTQAQQVERQTKDKMTYKDRKHLGIAICTDMVNDMNNLVMAPWQSMFQSSRKKDDLSDCFLQGLWFIRHHLY